MCLRDGMIWRSCYFFSRYCFNRHAYANDVEMDEEADFTIWINREGTELYAVVPVKESDRAVVSQIGSAGYKDYPGIWAVFDYQVMDASAYREFEEQHDRYEVWNPVPLEAVPKAKGHEAGEPLEHEAYLTLWELTYGDAGFSDHYNVEKELLSFRELFNAGCYGNENREIQLDEERDFTKWTDKDGTGLYATIPTKEADRIIVLQLGDAGYEDYPGICVVFDYRFVEASDYIEFKRQHERIWTGADGQRKN